MTRRTNFDALSDQEVRELLPRFKERNLEEQRSKNADIRGLVELARSQLGYEDRFAAGFSEPTARLQKTAGVSAQLGLRQYVPAVPNDYKAEYPRVVNRPAGEKITLAAALLDNSRVSQFGAHIICAQSAPPIIDSGIPIFYSRNQDFRITKPAIFTNIADGAEVSASTYPVAAASAPMADAPSSAVRFTISRVDSKKITDEQLEFEIMDSIARGLAREADRVLISAILATDPAPFTVGLAAAAGLRWSGLRALVGSSGVEVTKVRDDGKLLASGIEAELTDVTNGIIIGAFENSAVFVSDDIHLIIKRTNLDGSLEVSIFANMVAAIPDPSMFWIGYTSL